MASRPDAVIVGGGIIGLAAAWTLARRGAAVTLFERDPEPRGATWAAGGMLVPLGEAPDPGPFLSFGLAGLAAWPDWARDLEEAAERPVDFTRCGKLLVAADAEGAAALRRRFAWQEAAGHDVRWLDRAGVERVASTLAPAWDHGLHLPDQGRVDPRRTGRALAAAARSAGVELRFGEAVERILSLEGRVGGVRTTHGATVAAGAVVVAAGAWSGGLSGLPRPRPVRAVRGQMLSLELDAPVVDGLVAGAGAYLIPRRGEDDRPLLVVGASMEEAGFTLATDDPTVDSLRRAAEALVPALRDRPEHARWAGLRPGTPDDLPVLGVDPDLDGLIYATGHHRNGILLAPVTAEAVAGLVGGEALPDPWARAFAPTRFHGGG